MAKYSFTVSGSQLIVSLVPVLDDVQPTSMSYLAPSFKIGVGKINAYEYGQPKQSFLFTEIGEINGVEPTDLQDAFDELTTATANFNGGGASPYKVYTALLNQSGTNAPIATVLENTIGNIVWTRSVSGVYAATLAGAFLTDKTVVFIGKNTDYNLTIKGKSSTPNSLTFESRTNADNTITERIENDTIEIRVYN